LSKRKVRRAAKAVIQNYGTEALEEASEHVRVFKSRGYHFLAANWELIEEEIKTLLHSRPLEQRGN
jgi:hypothetical protein